MSAYDILIDEAIRLGHKGAISPESLTHIGNNIEKGYGTPEVRNAYAEVMRDMRAMFGPPPGSAYHTITVQITAPSAMTRKQVSDRLNTLILIGVSDAAQTLKDGEPEGPYFDEAQQTLEMRFEVQS